MYDLYDYSTTCKGDNSLPVMPLITFSSTQLPWSTCKCTTPKHIWFSKLDVLTDITVVNCLFPWLHFQISNLTVWSTGNPQCCAMLRFGWPIYMLCTHRTEPAILHSWQRNPRTNLHCLYFLRHTAFSSQCRHSIVDTFLMTENKFS